MKLQNRIDKNRILQIVAQTERSQLMNKLKAQKRFYELIENALKKEKVRKKTKPSVSSKENRPHHRHRLEKIRYHRLLTPTTDIERKSHPKLVRRARQNNWLRSGEITPIAG